MKESSFPPVRAASAQRYDAKDEIARGGMGCVYRALDRATGDTVALKRMLPSATNRADLNVVAFEREYQTLASLEHPRIVRVFDYGVDADGPYYIMELVTGVDLRKVVPLPWRSVCLLIRDVAEALALLHARHLLHRDLSPGNVKLDSEGHGKLLDFGALAHFGVHQTVVGTPPMIAPEALAGASLDQRTDLYALGALIYWCLTGRHAYPVQRLTELSEAWETAPSPPSSYDPTVPRTLDQLTLSLLARDPLARPASAAEVIARVTAAAELPAEAAHQRRHIAQSYLRVPPLVGRKLELTALSERLTQACAGAGSLVRVYAGAAGAGRSRLLDELAVQAQLTGAAVLRLDASMHPNHNGTTRALVLRLLDAYPEFTREHARQHSAALLTLDPAVQLRIARRSLEPLQPVPAADTDSASDVSEWLLDVSHHKPLVIAIDNIEACDSASLSTLLSLAPRLTEHAMLLVFTERRRAEPCAHKALHWLRAQAHTLELTNFTARETEALTKSLFADAPNAERFADWLYADTGGNPLYCVEMARQLIARDVIRHEAGLWVLPAARPQLALPVALQDAVLARFTALSASALELAQLLCLQRREPTLSACAALTPPSAAGSSEQSALGLLDELARQGVLRSTPSGYRFESTALRDALLASMDERTLSRAHLRLGNAFEHDGQAEPERLLEAGWHLMRGGADERGANLVANVLSNDSAVLRMVMDCYHIGPAAAAALDVYKRHRRSMYHRLPLLAALAMAGYFEDYALSRQYGDEALDVLDELTGMRAARTLATYLGDRLGLLLGIVSGLLRFMLTPRRDRRDSYTTVMRLAFTVMIPAVGASAMTLDADRAQVIARMLAPFARMPRSSTPRLIYDCCLALAQIGREQQAQAWALLEGLVMRLSAPRSFPWLPRAARPFLIAAVHFARGSFAVFRAHGATALESIRVLESSGFRLYGMIACQLRCLHAAYRGDFTSAARLRAEVELHAARLGSAWQVELWEPAALLPLHLATGDVVAMTQTVSRFDELVRIAPSLTHYQTLARCALQLLQSRDMKERELLELKRLQEIVSERPPRSFIGWCACVAGIAADYNRMGHHREAREVIQRALEHMDDADREFVILFVDVDLQAAIADAGLGKFDEAIRRVDGLLRRFGASDHALALGLLHEARARISFAAARVDDYRLHSMRMDHYFRPTGASALIAKLQRTTELGTSKLFDPTDALERTRRSDRKETG